MAPVRRASATGHNPGGSSGRVHRSNGSSHSIVAQTPPTTAHGSPYSNTSAGTTSTPQQKIVYVLVNRLKNKLPCYSGITLPDLENDDAVQQSVESLVDISRDSLDIVAWALTELVDKLQRNTDASGYRTIDALQSQLFVLKVLSIAMAARWSQRSDSQPQGPTMSSRALDSPNGFGARMGRSRQASAEQLAALSQWIEPPALDENCARYILSVMVVFLRQAAPAQQRLVSAANINFDASYHDLESIKSIDHTAHMDIFHSGPVTAPSIGSYYANAEVRDKSSWQNREPPDAQSVRTARHFPQHTISYERTSAVISGSMTALHTLIAKFAGLVVYHLSASNWSVVFSRIKNNIYTLASTADDEPDIMDVRLMTHCWLDRVRLVQLLQELSSLLVNMQRGAQTAICGPLRTAIWNWIEYHPEEFNDALLYHRRLEGAPERVFDILYSLIDVPNKAAVWPALTVLMCISSDRIRADYQVNSMGFPRGPPGRKDRNFAEILMRTLISGKVSDVPIVCALDVCRAASRVRSIENDGELPLQALATDVAHDIKMILAKWDGLQKPFWECPDEIDVGLVADALVTSFRFLGEDESIPIIRQALQPEMSEAVKISGIKACITLVVEGARLSCQKSLNNLKYQCVERLYGIFHSSITRRAEHDSNGVLKKAAYRPKAKRYTTETLPDRELALHAILALWRTDVHWFIDGLDPTHEDLWIPQTLSLWQAPVDYSVRLAIARTIRYIQEGLRKMSQESVQYKAGISWIMHCASGTMAAFGMNLLNCRTDFEAQRMWMHMSHELLYRLTRSMTKVQDTGKTEDWAAAFGLGEIAFLVTLTSADRVVSATASTCLRLIAIAERQKGSTPAHLISEEEKSKRYPVYEQLGASKALVLGRVADQKRIRKLLRLIALPTPSNVAVWEEAYWRWVGLNIMAQRASMDPSPEDGPRPNGDKSMSSEERQAQWQNLTLFLASFSAACLRENHDPAALATTIPARYLPDQMRVLRDPSDMLSQFLRSVVDLLISVSMQARDVAREALSNEAHPKLYPRILKQLDEVLLGMTGSEAGIAWDDVALFLEQFTSILKVIIENVQSSEDLRGIEIMSILQRVALWITRFHDMTSFRLKIKFCALCDSFMDHPELLSVRRDNAARLAITDCIIEWAQELTGARDSEQLRAQREINTATLRTAVKLFDRLELQSTGEDGQPVTGEEAGHTMARLFTRYSSFLFGMFDRTGNGMQDDCLSEQTTFSQTRTSTKDGDLRELIINGLASLISANPEHGVKHCLPVTFDADPAMRVVFAHAFARVVGKGLKFETPGIQPPSNKQSKLCELVKASDPALALAICEVCPPGEVDQIINVLLNMFDTRSSLMSLLKAMIDKEIARTESDTALFRSNSTCTRFLSAFAKIYGYSYLRDLIVPLMKTMTALPPGHCYDLDPTKAVNQDFTQNQKDLEFVASSFLDIITASVTAFPSMFREICAHIGKAVNDVWPEAKFSALGAFIFLRFISPAIVNPALVDVEVPADLVIRRGLMNIAKIMQNLANNIFFGKEMHMVPLNDFLSANIVNVTRFLSEINKYTPPDDEQEEWLDTAYDDTDNIVLHRFFERHADKVGKELLSASSKPADEADDEKSTGSGKRSWNAICNALVENTQASLIPTLPTLTSKEHPEYLALMSRYGHRDTSSVEHLFVPALTPKDQPVVFVLAVTKIDVEALDLELLLYYILKTLTSPAYENKKFDVVFDWTAFAQGAQIPTHWIKFACEIIPMDVRQRFRTSRMLSPNALALRYMRRLYNLTNGASLSTDFTMHVTTADLLRNYPEGTSFPSLTYAMELEDELAAEFDEVFMRHNHPMRVPVIMRIAQTHVRITMMKATNINNSSSCRATEIVLLADISDVYNVSTGHDTNEFIIRKIRHGTTLYFTSQMRDNIVKTIRNAKGSMRNVQIPGFERFSKLSNVIATLLHIGMVNIGDNNEELRVASYELLCSICTFLDFEGKPVVPTKTIFVPGRAGPFVTQLSEKLALFAPQLTLDFLTEVAAWMDKALTSQRIACLQYMSPWIRNLGCFTNPTHHLYEPSGAKFRDCIRVLIDLTLADQEIHAVIQKYIWSEIGRLESDPVNVILDELMRAAVDGGIGSQRCEIVADTMFSLSSINVRARIAARIRKVLGKTSSRPSKSLADNVHWNEIACLTRLCLVANYLPRNGTQAQLFVAEGMHYISLVAATGQLLVRTSIYGMVVNQLHSVYRPSGESNPLSPEIQELLDECARNETLMIFGLFKPTPTSDYAIYDPLNEKQYLDNLEKLGHLLLRIMQAVSGSQALLNIWRARWMSLITSSAFQTCPAIQTRAFISLGLLATTEVDDDLLYQILVALKSALESYDDSDPTAVISMLRCICKATPGLPMKSRYLVQLFWLAVALLQSSSSAVYIEAVQLVRISVETLSEQGAFKERGVAATLLDGRVPLEEIACQIDQLLGLSFESSFSFCLAAIIFRGLRQPALREHAETALRSLLRMVVHSCPDHEHVDTAPESPICADALGFFIALLPVSTTSVAFRQLLEEVKVNQAWYADEDVMALEDDDPISRVPFALLGITDEMVALYTTSFISSILSTAQGNDREAEVVYTLLSDIAYGFPDIIALSFDCLQDQIKDAFANASNPNTLSAVSNVFRIAMQDTRRSNVPRGSMSTLSTVEETNGTTDSRNHYHTLDDLGMRGLTSGFQFAGPTHSIKIIKWIGTLVMRMIEG